MATPINSTSNGDLWHLSIEDLLAPLPQSPRLGGAGPFVINLTASTAPVSQAKELIVDERLHVYQTQRTEEHRTRYRLRLGPFPTEDEADAALVKIRETYPGAFTANAETEDLRAILSWQAKMDALRLAAERAQSEVKAVLSPLPAVADAGHEGVAEVEVLEAPPIPVLTAAVRRAGAPVAPGPAAPKSTLEAAPKPVEPSAPLRPAPRRGTSAIGAGISRIATRFAPSSPLTALARLGTLALGGEAIPSPSGPARAAAPASPQPSMGGGGRVAAGPGPVNGAEHAAAGNAAPERATPIPTTRSPWRPSARASAPAPSVAAPAPSAVAPASGTAGPAPSSAVLVRTPPLERDTTAKPMITKAAATSTPTSAAPVRVPSSAPRESEPAQDPRAPVELSSKLPSLESTQTVRALTPIEIEDSEVARWYVIQLYLSHEAFDPDTLPNLDIFSEYRLYAVTGFDQGRVMHALRLGFFSEQVAAAAVASYLGTFYENPTVKRVSAAERERFADHRFEARKDIGATGKHAVIEITNERVVRERRNASLSLVEPVSTSAARTPPRPAR